MKQKTINVTLRGMTDIMFDRYPGNNSTELTPSQKLYYGQDRETIIIPALNIRSFLTAQNTTSATKVIFDSRKYKSIIADLISFVSIEPGIIPIMRNGKPIKFKGFNDDGWDNIAKIYVLHAVGRLKNGIPHPDSRPVVQAPWSISFILKIYETAQITNHSLYNIFEQGGIRIGLGSGRGLGMGRFEVEKWE